MSTVSFKSPDIFNIHSAQIIVSADDQTLAHLMYHKPWADLTLDQQSRIASDRSTVRCLLERQHSEQSVMISYAESANDQVRRSRGAAGLYHSRLYGIGPCLQKLKREIRGIMCEGVTTEVDVKNCHPTILAGLCRLHDIECVPLNIYIRNRDRMIQAGDLSKLDILRMMYTDRRIEGCDGYARPFFEGLLNNVALIRDKLEDIGVISASDISDRMQEGSRNPRCSALSALLCTEERRILMTLCKGCAQLGLTAGTLIHDGMMIKGTVSADQINVLQDMVRLAVGYDVTIATKEHAVPQGWPLDAPPTIKTYDEFNISTPPVDYDPRIKVTDLRFSDKGYISNFHPLFENGDKSVVVVKAGMGSGKTHQITRRVKQFVNANPTARILFISCRRAFSYSQHGGPLERMGFVHYLSPGAFSPENRLIVCQYESIHRLKTGSIGFAPFDLVVCDELRSICAQAISTTTNGYNKGTNLRVMRSFFRLANASGKVLCVDADIECDNTVRDLIQKVGVDMNRVHVVRYNEHKIRNNIHITKDSDSWIDQLKTQAVAGVKIAVCCRLKTDAIAIQRLMADAVPADKTKVYTGDSDAELIKDFRSINDKLIDIQLVIMTSTVTVGADVTIPWGKIFFHLGGARNSLTCCSARDLLQMSGRFRNVADNDIPCLFASKTLEFPSASARKSRIEGIISSFASKKMWTESWARDIIGSKRVVIDGKIAMAPNYVYHLHLNAAIEREEDILWSLCTLAVAKGYGVRLMHDNFTANADKTAATKDTKKERIEREDNIIRELLQLDHTGLMMKLKEAKDVIGDNTNTLDTQILYDYGSALQPFYPINIPGVKFNVEDVRNMKKHKKGLRRMAGLRRVRPVEFEVDDVERSTKRRRMEYNNGVVVKVPVATPLPDMEGHQIKSKRDECFIDLVRYFSSDPAADFRDIAAMPSAPPQHIEVHADEVLKKCASVLQAAGVRQTIVDRAGNLKKGVVSMKNCLLWLRKCAKLYGVSVYKGNIKGPHRFIVPSGLHHLHNLNHHYTILDFKDGVVRGHAS